MVCGIYMCSVCLKQTNVHTNTKFQNVEINQRHCHDLTIDKSQTPYLNYPKPTTFSRAECACNPVCLFAIISMQRSGSGWFETLLNSHTNVSSNGEIFSSKERRSNFSSIYSTLDRVYNLDWFTSASKNQCSAAVGFKWMLNQNGMVSLHANSYDRYANINPMVTQMRRKRNGLLTLRKKYVTAQLHASSDAICCSSRLVPQAGSYSHYC